MTFVYIIINETNYPVCTFINIDDARNYKKSNENYKIIKSTLYGELPTVGSKLKEKMGLNNINEPWKTLPDELKNMFNIKK
jgi:hypothetical protein